MYAFSWLFRQWKQPLRKNVSVMASAVAVPPRHAGNNSLLSLLSANTWKRSTLKPKRSSWKTQNSFKKSDQEITSQSPRKTAASSSSIRHQTTAGSTQALVLLESLAESASVMILIIIDATISVLRVVSNLRKN